VTETETVEVPAEITPAQRERLIQQGRDEASSETASAVEAARQEGWDAAMADQAARAADAEGADAANDRSRCRPQARERCA
jgi:hypothetical protein